jgi:hypothetical protein
VVQATAPSYSSKNQRSPVTSLSGTLLPPPPAPLARKDVYRYWVATGKYRDLARVALQHYCAPVGNGRIESFFSILTAMGASHKLNTGEAGMVNQLLLRAHQQTINTQVVPRALAALPVLMPSLKRDRASTTGPAAAAPVASAEVILVEDDGVVPPSFAKKARGDAPTPKG